VHGSGSVFALVPRRRLIGLSFGALRSARRGSGNDVAGSRLYVPGDDVDAIDWRASAKLSSARSSDEFIVRESYAEEAPRVVVVCDHRPSMSLHPPHLPWLSKPTAAAAVARLVADAAIACRGYLGYVDVAEPEPLWVPPRLQRDLAQLGEERPFTAPPDALDRAFAHLELHRRSLGAGSFVFVLSDFLEPPPEHVWLDAIERHWDVVPVVIQDPTWEQSFPDVGGIVVPLADPATGRVAFVRLTAREAAARRRRNEERLAALLDRFEALDLQPVLVSTSDPDALLEAFLDWGERRRMLHGRPL
jgi:uncharacterized protein (DUF58 family)